MGKIWKSGEDDYVIIKDDGSRLHLKTNCRYLGQDRTGLYITFRLIKVEYISSRQQYIMRVSEVYNSNGTTLLADNEDVLFTFNYGDRDNYSTITPTEIVSLLETMLYNTNKLKQNGK